jgi:prepilin peptidase CpaA
MISDKNIVGTTMVLVLLALLAVATATDCKNHRIPNLLLIPALSLALILHTMNSGIYGLIASAGGFTLGLAMFLPLYVIGGTGAGDVKLLGVVGSFLGPWGVVVAGLATMMAGAALGIIIIAWQRIWPAVELRVSQLVSPPNTGVRSSTISNSLKNRNQITRIAYAPAIAAGTVAALWYMGYLPEQFIG